MMTKLNGFIGPTYTLPTVNYDCQRTINLYPELDELRTGKEQEVAMLRSVPGQTLALQMPKGPIRGLHFTAFGTIICVAGNTVYVLNSLDKGLTWTNPTPIADLTTSIGPVCISDGIPNYYQGVVNSGAVSLVIVVDGSNYGIAFQEGTTIPIQLNSGNSYNGANFVTFQDGFFMFTQNTPSPTVFFASDPLNINLVDEVTANLGPDYVSRVISDHDVLWFFGGRSSSVWQNTGGSLGANIFQQIPGSYAEGGCSYPWTINKVSGQILWLGTDERGYGQIMQGVSYRGVRVSNHSVEAWLQSFNDLSGATSWTYQDGGHSFYCLNIPGATTTWVYDLTTKMWSERSYYKDGVFYRDNIEHHITTFNPNYVSAHLCGDYNSGNLYTLSNEVFTLNGEPIYRMRTAPHSSSGLRRVYYSQLQADIETGTGLDHGGFNYVEGMQPIGYESYAQDMPLGGDGIGGIYNWIGNDGNVAIPDNNYLTDVTADGLWSNSWTDNGNGTVSLNMANFPVSSTRFGVGTGALQTYTFVEGGLAAGTTVNTANIYEEDWRGGPFSMSEIAPVTNFCTDSQNFANTGTWLYDGVTISPSSWNQYPVTTVGIFRPTAGAVTSSGGSITNPTYAYDSTYDTLKTSGTFALFAAIGNNAGVTYSQDIYSAFGAGLNITGTLNICLSSTSPGPAVLGAYDVNVYYSIDAGANWILYSQAVGGAGAPNQPDYSIAEPLHIPLTVTDISQLQVKILCGTDRGPGTETCSVYDIVFIQTATTASSPTPENAPDGTNTGTYLVEDTSNGYHGLGCSYTPAAIYDHVCASCYYQIGDSTRSLELAVLGQQTTFTGSITGNQLTVIVPPITGSISTTQSITGIGIPPGVIIIAGVSSPYTLSWSAPIPISATVFTTFNYLALGTFSPLGVANNMGPVMSAANMVSVGTVFSGSILGDQLTVNQLYSGSLNPGYVILGDGIPGGVTITAGTISPYTLSWTAPSPIITEMMSATGGPDTGIYRCYVEGTEEDAGLHHAYANIYDANSQYGDFYVGNGASRVGIWGFMIENNSLHQYIKSTSGVSGSDYITLSVDTGTVYFNIAPLNYSILTWNGDVTGYSLYPTLYKGTFSYTQYPPITVPLGIDPQVSLSYSDNGGHTFSPERTISMGKIGNYLGRCIWRNLGQSRDRVYRITCKEPVKFSLIGCEIRAKEAELNG